MKRPNVRLGRIVTSGIVTVLLGGGLATASEATAPVQGLSDTSDELAAQWTPWLGCWSLWQEQFQDPESLREVEENGPDGEGGIVGRTSVCVTPTDSGAALRATADGRVLIERTIVADGVRHDVAEDGCRGWEQNEWSHDGQRLFTRGELQCEGSPHRTVSGVSFMASSSVWVDVQVVRHAGTTESGAREQLEVRRYAPMTDAETERLASWRFAHPTSESGSMRDFDLDLREIRRARRRAAEALVMADVMDASARSTPRVVEALLIENEPDLSLSADTLISLDDAGIDHGVIDLLVALSYPERFVVERRGGGGGWSSGGFSGFGGMYDSIWYDRLYPYYVSPFGYNSYLNGGLYNPYLYGFGASPFVVLPGRENVGDGIEARASRTGGYTRVRARETFGPMRRGGGGGGVRTGSSSGGRGYSGGSSSGIGGSSSGGGGGGRTATPR